MAFLGEVDTSAGRVSVQIAVLFLHGEVAGGADIAGLLTFALNELVSGSQSGGSPLSETLVLLLLLLLLLC